ncbi:MAG: hypothetical protein CMJ76_04075 [Planctomycetaceae bacterium]|nr:hypothetical protein [Planctomycetaceae bacterium]|tara:strand:- start:60 stop:623 length:564 start_codon:yes stop_codon:yes gene_type:complete
MLRKLILLMLLLTVAMLYCDPTEAAVRRRITIKTTPPGALVYIDDQEIGVTPVSTSFTYYGTRKIQIVKDGYETVTVLREIKPPWYQIPGIDFVTENLITREFRDERLLQFKLVPLRIRTTEELIKRGQELKQRARQRVVAPPGTQPRSLRQSYPNIPANPAGIPANNRRPVRVPQLQSQPRRLPQR